MYTIDFSPVFFFSSIFWHPFFHCSCVQVNHVLNMILDHQLSKDWRGVCARCVPGRKVFHPADADVESAGEAKVRESEDQDTG